MKKETRTRTRRLLSKKQGQKVVSLGMAITLFAPLLLAPIVHAEEVNIEDGINSATSEEAQAAVTLVPETMMDEEATQTVTEDSMTEELISEAIDESSIISEESAPPEVSDSPSTATEELASSSNDLSVTTEEVQPIISEEKASLDPAIIAEYQGIIDGLAVEIDELVALGATDTQVQGLRNGIGNLQYQLNEYIEGWQTKEAMDTLFVPWVNEMRAEIATIKESLKKVSVTGVTLSELPELNIGETHTLVATITPTNATNLAVSFSSNNPSVATVDASGQVTAISAGSYAITVTTTDGGFTATVNGIVKEATPKPEIPVEGVSLSQTELGLNEGDSAKLTATVTPENATNKGVAWTVDNEAIVSIDSSGYVTGIKEGTATVTATTIDGAYTASCTITVTKKTIVVPPVDPTPDPTPKPTPEPLPTPIAPSSPKDELVQSADRDETIKPLGTTAIAPIDLSATKNQSAVSSSQDSLPKAGEIESPTTLWGMILVGVASIGTFIFKRKQSH